ncbi:hypothetical protein [Mycolicibacterium sp.]|uniref:hypothetical protein n=1 Tax=Mycolicibacterium sp. TaxID=2320850 RepID=UPI003D14FA88
MKILAFALFGAAVAMGCAPAAVAAPDCTPIGGSVTYCETKGSTQLITTPPPWNYGGWQGLFGFSSPFGFVEVGP